ncbi:unnamed protein product [Ilex paraguariensis]|uniref:Thionin-like protein n=1 Tax=Ilex paraguariensis TaxID=185542 RepID=A0ABC8TB99_9AQUA
MEWKSVRIVGVVAFLVVLVLAKNVTAQPAGDGVYACWGGCYNECILRTGKDPSQRLPCYGSCLGQCVPQSPSDYQYYCQIGCSFESCILFSYDGASLERCIESCANLCKP